MSIGLILKLLFSLPSIISTVIKIINFIKNFKKDGFLGIGELAEQILEQIIGLIGKDNARAKKMATQLKAELTECEHKKRRGILKRTGAPKRMREMLNSRV